MESTIKKINLVNLSVTILPFCILLLFFGNSLEQNISTSSLATALLLFSLLIVVVSNKDGYKKSLFESNFVGLVFLIVSVTHALLLSSSIYSKYISLSDNISSGFFYALVFWYLYLPSLAIVLLRSYYQVFKNSKSSMCLKVSVFGVLILGVISLANKIFWLSIPLIGYLDTLPSIVYSFAEKIYYPISNIEAIFLALFNLVIINVALFCLMRLIFFKKELNETLE